MKVLFIFALLLGGCLANPIPVGQVIKFDETMTNIVGATSDNIKKQFQLKVPLGNIGVYSHLVYKVVCKTDNEVIYKERFASAIRFGTSEFGVASVKFDYEIIKYYTEFNCTFDFWGRELVEPFDEWHLQRSNFSYKNENKQLQFNEDLVVDNIKLVRIKAPRISGSSLGCRATVNNKLFEKIYPNSTLNYDCNGRSFTISSVNSSISYSLTIKYFSNYTVKYNLKFYQKSLLEYAFTNYTFTAEVYTNQSYISSIDENNQQIKFAFNLTDSGGNVQYGPLDGVDYYVSIQLISNYNAEIIFCYAGKLYPGNILSCLINDATLFDLWYMQVQIVVTAKIGNQFYTTYRSPLNDHVIGDNIIIKPKNVIRKKLLLNSSTDFKFGCIMPNKSLRGAELQAFYYLNNQVPDTFYILRNYISQARLKTFYSIETVNSIYYVKDSRNEFGDDFEVVCDYRKTGDKTNRHNLQLIYNLHRENGSKAKERKEIYAPKNLRKKRFGPFDYIFFEPSCILFMIFIMLVHWFIIDALSE
uniref:Ig-like domain-containing protein n=1 Tax=Rhabditophanes sp. KR3021 TaxID=114890 RepID=A0AC35U088_9BILA